jgi:diguanylate cyclase (GGDEF)-like protein/PAS domain S-box-containing protein
VDVNETTVKMWNHSDRTNLLGNLQASLPEKNLEQWVAELTAIFEGRLYYMIEDQLVASRAGNTLHANLYWSVVPGHENDWSQVLVSAVDITKQIETENSLHASEERLRMMIENADDIILLQDLHGKYLYYNGQPRYGMTTEDMLGKYPSDLFEPMIAEEIMQSILAVIHSKKTTVIEIPTNRGGETNWFSNLVYPVISDSGEVMAIGTISRNITTRKQSEQALAEMQKALSSRVQELEKLNQEISLLSQMLTLLQVSSEMNEAYSVIHQFLQQLFPGLSGGILEIQPGNTSMTYKAAWGIKVDPKITPKPDDCWALRSGKKHFVDDPDKQIHCPHFSPPYPKNTLCVPYIIDSTPAGCLFLQSTPEKTSIQEADINLAQTASEQIGLALTNIGLRIGLRQQAIHDALTGMYNRHYLEETMSRELYRQERSRQPLSVIMMDMDRLKQINDMYGHAAGDAVLRELGKLIKRSIRVSDMPCRFGGDEFILVMPDTTIETAVRRAEFIAETFKQHSIPFGTQTLGGFTLSIGVSCTSSHGHTSQDLLDAADRALYQAKRNGRDRVVRAEEPPQPEDLPANMA